MRFGKFAVLGGLVLAAGGAVVAFGPLVRARVADKAARYGAVVTVEQVRPIWLGARLEGVSITIPDVPGVRVRLNEVSAELLASGGLREVRGVGGDVEVRGAPDELVAQLKAWSQRWQRGAGEGGGASTPVGVSGLRVRWEFQEDRASASGVSVERETSSWKLVADRAEAKRGEQGVVLQGGQLALGRGESGARVLGWKVKQLALEVALEAEEKGEAKGPPAPAPIEKKPDEKSVLKKKPKEIEAEKIAAQEERGAQRQKQAAAWKKKIHEGARAVKALLAESGEVEQIQVTVRRGGESLHVGPNALSIRSNDKGVSVSLSPSQVAEGGSPLLLSADLPVEESEGLALRVSGGPVTLKMLGIHEGDMGLLDIQKTTVEAGGEVKLSGAADRVDVDLRGVLKALSISHPKLSVEPVKGLDLRFAWVGGGALDGSSLRVDRGELDVGKVHGEASGQLERRGGVTKISGKFSVPLASCQSGLDALPAGLTPKLVGMKMGGTFSLGGRVAFDGQRPAETQVDFQLSYDCRVEAAPPDVEVGRFRRPFRRMVYDASGKQVEVESGPGTPGWVSLPGITPFMESAVLTTEDGGFRRHRGFDLEAIRNSMKENLRAGRFARGASTISMQTAKNLYLTRDKTVGRKLQEAVLTLYLEQALSKDQILELYLNSIEFGPMIYGIGPAAQHYFKTSAGELSLGQALYLSSILPNPKRQYFGPDGKVFAGHMGYLHRLMKGMAKRRLIPEDELEAGLAEWVVFGQPPEKRKEKVDEIADEEPR